VHKVAFATLCVFLIFSNTNAAEWGSHPNEPRNRSSLNRYDESVAVLPSSDKKESAFQKPSRPRLPQETLLEALDAA